MSYSNKNNLLLFNILLNWINYGSITFRMVNYLWLCDDLHGFFNYTPNSHEVVEFHL
jgi:hypothetical protein